MRVGGVGGVEAGISTDLVGALLDVERSCLLGMCSCSLSYYTIPAPFPHAHHLDPEGWRREKGGRGRRRRRREGEGRRQRRERGELVDRTILFSTDFWTKI